MRTTKSKTFPFVLMLLMFAGINLRAQQVYEITAKDAIDIAFKNVNELKNARLDYKIAEARNQEIIGLALPQVSGKGQGNHYLSLPQIQFPDGTEKAIYQVLKDNGIKDGSGNPITKDGEFLYRRFSFITPWNVSGGINVQQLLFEPQVFVGLEARKTLLEASDYQVKVAEEKVKEAVYKNYYAVLIAEKQLSFMEESIKRLEKLESDMNQMYKNGFVEKLDVDKTTVTLNNTRTNANQLRNAIDIGYAVLKMTIGVTQGDSLVLKDNLTPQKLKEGILEDDFQYENRNEVKLLNSTIKLNGYDVRRYKLSYAPTIAAFYDFTRTGQRNAQGNDNSPWFWYNTNMVGLSVNLPIFDGFQKKNKIKQSKLTLEKTQNSLDELKKGIDLEKTAASKTLNSAILNMDIQEKNAKLAENVFNTEKKKYEQGLGSSIELLRSDSEMQLAQSNFFKAVYDALIAKITYLKALGKL